MEKVITIKNKTGLHARPVTKFVHACRTYESKVYLSKNGNKILGDSIIKIMSLGIAYGDQLIVSAEGPDAEKAVNELSDFLGNYEE